MAAGAIIPAVGLALGTASTVASISQQNAQYSAQQNASLASAMEAEERAQLALARYQTIQESARLVRDRELALVSAQRQAATLQQHQAWLNNRLAEVQTNLAASQLEGSGRAQNLYLQGQGIQQQNAIENQALQGSFQSRQAGIQEQSRLQQEGINTGFALRQQGNQYLGQRYGESTEAQNALSAVGQQNAQQYQQVGQAYQQLGQQQQQGFLQKGQAGTQKQLNTMDVQNSMLAGAYGDVAVGAQQRTGAAQFGADQSRQALMRAGTLQGQLGALGQQYESSFNSYATQVRQAYEQQAASIQGLSRYGTQVRDLATRMGSNAEGIASLQSAALRTQQQYTTQALAQSDPLQTQINQIQSQRNRMAIRAGYQSTRATGSMSALSQVIQERANIAGAYAQAAQGSGAGVGAYLGAIGKGVAGAYQMGLFNFGSSTSAQQAQNPSMTGYGAAYGAVSGIQALNQPMTASTVGATNLLQGLR